MHEPRSLENLAGSYTEYGINGIQGTSRILDSTQTSERKFRPRFLVEFSLFLSPSGPRAEKDNRGWSLNRKKADKQRHKVAVYLRYRHRSMGVKNGTIHGGGRWTITIPVRFLLSRSREYRTRIEKGTFFHSIFTATRWVCTSKLWNCVRICFRWIFIRENWIHRSVEDLICWINDGSKSESFWETNGWKGKFSSWEINHCSSRSRYINPFVQRVGYFNESNFFHKRESLEEILTIRTQLSFETS